jgi:hypothetical protein
LIDFTFRQKGDNLATIFDLVRQIFKVEAEVAVIPSFLLTGVF